ncbi:hypothetical protein PUW24_16800 [Paenibacillus urinalis]|uniref:Uncharacterized protein n=1 Tax=Paenibacillus urinalis TaxID=521520 RepID=A0AAX3N3R1_9BACL|nr:MULTISPECIES: hypothetical protein [Paenibacillus]WDH84380.1 hypothetical protein PUW23_09295 [Paenibacillus urinalis]WDH95847.1 hypothetical protein PUW24_16800 [Paenibacillus urinalis]WDI04064.1 hypothetical protein PUW25_08990 [Paenibacillus urinalis]GAK38623.1 hypothetical protein TCA2_0349 [Paenibacillus sp. TCA20]
MAFGISRQELENWKHEVKSGKLAYLTHYWIDPRFPGVTSVTKVGCADLEQLRSWCIKHDLNPKYIHHRNPFPHFDLLGPKQKEILQKEQLDEHIERFRL